MEVRYRTVRKSKILRTSTYFIQRVISLSEPRCRTFVAAFSSACTTSHIKAFKPRETLKKSDKYKTKIELATEMISELIDFGFKIQLVLSDSLYGESSQFVRTLEKNELGYIVAISL